MSMRFSICAGVLFVILGGIGDSGVSAQSAATDNGPGVKRALLIGINKYQAVPKLQGSINDIETMRQILLTRWGFPERYITVVTDEAATRAGILAALEQLVKETGPQDTVYFHFSGHGSQVEDLNGDEKDDGLDETIVPQDGRSGDVRDITDDELDAVFARLRAKNAFIVLDSCHSGTATRSLDIRTRSIPQDNRIDIYRKAEQASLKTRAVVPVVTSRYVVMTGAASHQEALDGPVDGRYHGFFTFALARSLSSSGAAATPREVFSGVERELKRIQAHFGRSSMPEPQLEAPPDLLDKTLLGAPSGGAGVASPSQNTRLPWLEVQPGVGGQVTLVSGVLLGAGPGSIWTLYPPGEINFQPGRALAVATVTQISGKDSLARLQKAEITIPKGARAVALLPAASGEKIPIRILDVPQERRKHIEEILKKNITEVELVGQDKTARFLVDVKGTDLRLLTADGLEVVASFSTDNDQWGAGLALVVSRSANASELLTLDNPSSQLKVNVRVVNAAVQKESVGTRGIAVVAGNTKAAQYRIRRPKEARSEKNSLQLEVSVSADSYLTIVDVDSEGGVNLLFPNNYQERSFVADGFVRAGETVLIPDSLKPSNRAGFYWDYTPPKGTDTVRVFTSTDVQTAQMLRQRVQTLQTTASQTSGGVKTRGVAASIGTIRQDLAKIATRGIVTVYDPTSHVPGAPIADQPEPSSSVAPAPAAPVAQTPPVPASEPAVPTSPAADWAATSVTILVEG
jgi:hypothetical protein